MCSVKDIWREKLYPGPSWALKWCWTSISGSKKGSGAVKEEASDFEMGIETLSKMILGFGTKLERKGQMFPSGGWTSMNSTNCVVTSC